MPTLPEPDDKRLQRFAWLLQINFAGRMIDLHHRPHYVPNSTDPAHQLQNSLHLLLRILNTQTD
jgi:hypothetical protein